MNEKKLLADEELEQVSGGSGGKAKEEYCGKWYVDNSNPKHYVYVKKTNSDFFYATHYTLDGGNVNVREDTYFKAYAPMYTYTEVSISDLPEAVRKVAEC